MSFRQEYAATAVRNIENLNPMANPLARTLKDLPADIARLRHFLPEQDQQTGKSGKLAAFAKKLFSRNSPRGLRGHYNSSNNTLSYDLILVNREQSHRSDPSCYSEVAERLRQSMGAHLYGDAYVSRQASVQTDQMYTRIVNDAAQKTAQAALSELRGQAVGLQDYRGIHDVCAGSDVDCRIELVTEVKSWQRTGDSSRTVATILLRAVVYLDQPYEASSDRVRFEKTKSTLAASTPSV